MASRQITLTALKTGITRLRDKGGASPDGLYDLLNGYIDQAGAPRSRSGTSLVYTLPAGTKGLVQYGGKLLVLALTAPTITNSLFTYKIIKHPDPSFSGTIKTVHFAKPMLGWIYAVVEFSDGQILHYWLQEPTVWKAGTNYAVNASVSPSVGNGFYYVASRDNPPPAWQPNTQYALGDIVQPSAYNGFQYTVADVSGSNAASGSTEPVWPTTNGAQVNEDANDTLSVNPTYPSAPPVSPVGSKYTNLTNGKTL